MRARRPRHTGAHGQAIVEFSLIIPILIALCFGTWAGATFINDRQIAAQATRAGSRVGAELGNNGYKSTNTPALCQTSSGSAKDPCVVDAQMLSSVITVATALVDAGAITEVDIYKPCTPVACGSGDTGVCSAGTTGGDYRSGNPVDVYKPVGGTLTLQGTAGYTLDLRSQAHPAETVVGVRVVYSFTAPGGFAGFNAQTSEFSVMCLAPKEQV